MDCSTLRKSLLTLLYVLLFSSSSEAQLFGQDNGMATQRVSQQSFIISPGGDSISQIGLQTQYGILVRQNPAGETEMYGTGGWIPFNDQSIRQLIRDPHRYRIVLNNGLIGEAIRVSGIGDRDGQWLRSEGTALLRRIDLGRSAYEIATGVTTPIWRVTTPIESFTILTVPVSEGSRKFGCTTLQDGRPVAVACPD
jgi:hypothetical protein